jgi:hypothetical protein
VHVQQLAFLQFLGQQTCPVKGLCQLAAAAALQLLLQDQEVSETAAAVAGRFAACLHPLLQGADLQAWLLRRLRLPLLQLLGR